ncbi:MAG: VOC family protein [Gammaproteobacteria bacterium]|nr:VOC family protein [Gammaproteobacteria bacterium]
MGDDKGRVTGLGGIFFKTGDKAETLAWYRDRLGVQTTDFGSVFLWREHGDADETGYTVWSPFAADTEYFAPSDAPFMVNFRVENLDALLTSLRAEGVRVVGGPVDEPNGRFAWIVDPEGRKIELWEPVPSKDDPYLAG